MLLPGFLLCPLRAPWEAVLVAKDSGQFRGQTQCPEPQIPSLASMLAPPRGWTAQPPFPAQHRITGPILHDPLLSAAPSTGHRGSCTFWQPSGAGDHCRVSRPCSLGGLRGQGRRQLAVFPATRRTTPPGQLLFTLQNPGWLSPCLGSHGCPGTCWAEWRRTRGPPQPLKLLCKAQGTFPVGGTLLPCPGWALFWADSLPLTRNHPRPSRKGAWEPSFRNHSPPGGFVTPREELPDDRQAQEEKQCEP